MKNYFICLSFLSLVFFCQNLKGQKYYKTHVPDKLVPENIFLKSAPDTSAPPSLKKIKSQLPQPYWPSRQDAISCYWKTWEIAFVNLHKVNPATGFVSPFIDPAFNGNIF